MARAEKQSFYEAAMDIFNNAADVIHLHPRVRLELEEPDFEHIFYVTVELRDRLVPIDDDAGKYKDLPASDVKALDALEPLANGSYILHRRALLRADVEMRRGVIRIPGKGVFGHSKRRILHAKDVTGREIERALLQAISQQPNIQIF